MKRTSGVASKRGGSGEWDQTGSGSVGRDNSTLFDWISGLKVNESGETVAVLAEDWPPSKKLQTISLFDSLPESERGEFLRKQGLTSVHVQKWRSTLLAALDKRDQEKARLEQRVRQLERELEKKDKALAEAATLLILQKKTQSLFNESD